METQKRFKELGETKLFKTFLRQLATKREHVSDRAS
jgi:hypothetical protein